MKVATAAPSVQAVFEVLGPALPAAAFALAGNAACTPRPPTASDTPKPLADTVALAQARPPGAHDVASRTASRAATRRVASAGFADACMRFAADPGLGARA
ncbi:hypothetical protein L2Y90_31775 (plasmid) [Burkholderia pyrrocinia]|uniref:hypothetical protein n=1 Tax=Burkholderia pyrrocinia TaxID=60550 RepID=UPI00215A3778|nr:hypothetical protein [Burkholderia pyrrocinia]UVE70404.1 hypothetical protein L2Y90_31775 [Burkholderia pyrrocinia]